MADQSIQSHDLSISQVFQSFYRVPDYQREYVWGEADGRTDRGDEIEQFLRDIHAEFEQATKDAAPEYFIGTIVVCAGRDDVFDLIDGQQRTTTSFLTLCALRDAMIDHNIEVPSTLRTQIADSATDWKGETVHRTRLDLQYEDSNGILDEYAGENVPSSSRDETRSIKNIVNAYETVKEFLKVTFNNNPSEIRSFYGYFTNKVKLIRIETPSVSRALKIFETINDRGIGLDAMDLLKNLLFMNAKPSEFDKLKIIWKELTQQIYEAGEKPLRFLRYFLIANYQIDSKTREEEIYDWLVNNEKKTGYETSPLSFAENLRESAKAYAQFMLGNDKRGIPQVGIRNTRALGGSAIKQHFVLLLAGKDLPKHLFSRLCSHVEDLMFVWLIAGVAAKEYDRLIAQAAAQVRLVKNDAGFDKFYDDFITKEMARHKADFHQNLLEMFSWDLRKFRLKYLLAKITQAVDIEAYGISGRDDLSHYLNVDNDIEHIIARTPTAEASGEFGEGADDDEWVESLGNLMWIERSINRSIRNKAYSDKVPAYETSQFLWARCQGGNLVVGANDQITRTAKTIYSAKAWDVDGIEARQAWIADKAVEVWGVA